MRLINLVKVSARIILYLILFVAFYYFYLLNSLNAYLSNLTTFASRYEEVQSLEPPTITLCMEPGQKFSVMTNKFNITSYPHVISGVEKVEPPNITFEDFRSES